MTMGSYHNLALDQLYDGHQGPVSLPGAQLGNASVSPRAFHVSGGQFVEYLFHHLFVGQLAQGQPAMMQSSLLSNDSGLLGFGQGGFNPLVAHQIGGEATK